jgi:hypothetical protein
VDQDVTILAIIQERGLNLEKIRMILDEELTAGFIGSFFQLLEEGCHLGQVQVVHHQSLVDGSLNGVSDSAESVPELVLDLGEPGVKQHGVGHNGVEESHPHLVEGVLDSHEIL